MHNTPVVYLGANHYTALGGIRTLGRRGVKVYALDYDFSVAYAITSRYVYRKVLCPNINDSEENLVDFLVELAGKLAVKPVLIASHDAYAILISKYSDALARHYLFHHNPEGLLEQFVDKKGLSLLATKHGMKMPATHFPGSSEEDIEIVKYIPYPCLVKPALSHKFVKVFREKCFVVNTPKELTDALKMAREAEVEVMVQEIIPGFDDHMFMFDVFIRQDGHASHTLTAQKLRQFPINFGSSTLSRQLYVPELISPGLDFLQKVEFRGFCELEYKRHAGNNEYYMIEINARLTSINLLLDACGMESAYLIYRDLTGKPVADNHIQKDLNISFYHFYEDIFAVKSYLRAGQLSLKEAISPLLTHKKVYAVWASDDPMPLLHFLKQKLFKLFSKASRLLTERIKLYRSVQEKKL